MKNLISYKNYSGTFEFIPEDNSYYGRLNILMDLVTFGGKTIEQLQTSFEEAVDDYLIFCHEHGKLPNEPIAETEL